MVINEIETLETFRIELANVGTATADIDGLMIVSPDGAYTCPPRLLEPGAFLVLNAEVLEFSSEPGDLLSLMGPGGNVLLDAQRASDRLRAIHFRPAP